MMECDQIKDMLEAYVLGTLDAEERALVERHLPHCPECQRRVNELTEAANALPQALAAASRLRMPDDLKDRVMRSVEQSSREESPRGAQVNTPQSSQTTMPLPTTSNGGILERIGRWLGMHRRLRTLGLLAALLIAVAIVAWNVQLNVALARERALRVEFAQLVSQQQELVIDVIDSSKTVRAILRPPEGAPPTPSSPYGKLFARPDLPYVVIMAARLPQPSAGQVYRVWLSRNGETKHAGVLMLNQGFGMLVLDTGQIGPTYESAQIRLQAPDSSTPSGPIVLQWLAK